MSAQDVEVKMILTEVIGKCKRSSAEAFSIRRNAAEWKQRLLSVGHIYSGKSFIE